MKIEITKYKNPIIWLDTNFIITMARNNDPRSAKLMNFLKERQGIYFLVEGEDTELSMGNGNMKQYLDLLTKLSFGVSFLPYELIEQLQFKAVARTFLGNKNSAILETSDYIKSDPMQKYKQFKEIGLLTGSHSNLPIMRSLNKNTKEEIFIRLNKERPSGRSIAEQQELESGTPAKIFRLFLHAMMKKREVQPGVKLKDLFEGSLEDGTDFANHFEFSSKRIQWWRAIGGSNNLLDALGETYKFTESESFKNMPFNRINSILWGDIYAGNETIKASDYWDVKHISAVLPFCNIIFTEKRMSLRIKQYSLDREYQTEVYSMQNIEEFFQKHKK